MATAEPGPESSMPALELSIGQQFEVERFSRVIDATTSVESLRGIAKQLLHAWHTQKAATNWLIRQQCGATMPGIAEPKIAGLSHPAAPDAQIPPPWDDPLA